MQKKDLTDYVYDNLSKHLFPTLKKESSLVEYLARILYLALSSARNQTKLNLFIQYSKTTYGYDLIKNKLSTIFNSTVLEFTFDIDKADIIISDSYESLELIESNGPMIFYFEYPYDEAVWQSLTKFINQQICSKLS
ncbi:hypothetical protein [Enterococcus sp. AZ192]|uniref:hypothetical protein n=1 Tax=unclassified Enterococcus TaxID=2608891 RepID=UPI003D287619